MMEVFLIIFIFLFILSFVVNVVFFKYASNTTEKLELYRGLKTKLNDVILAYHQHLETVYKLNVLFKNEVLINLMKHTKEVKEFMDVYVANGLLDEPSLEELSIIEEFGMDQNNETTNKAEQ